MDDRTDTWVRSLAKLQQKARQRDQRMTRPERETFADDDEQQLARDIDEFLDDQPPPPVSATCERGCCRRRDVVHTRGILKASRIAAFTIIPRVCTTTAWWFTVIIFFQKISKLKVVEILSFGKLKVA